MALSGLSGRTVTRQQLVFVILCCITVLVFLSFNWSSAVEPEDGMQELRKSLFRDFCDRKKASISEGKRSIDQMSNEDLKHLLVDDNHGIIYCYIPKVAGTSWKRVMWVLNQSLPYADPSSIPGHLLHVPNKLMQLTSGPRDLMKVKLKHYTKFLFVRDPLMRLISVYWEKFQRPNSYFYQNFGKKILRLHGKWLNPPETLEDAVNFGVRPSFHNFIQYLLDPTTEMNEPFQPLWRQMHRLCHPCHIPYDFVGHQETLQEDAAQLLRILKLENDIKFPLPHANVSSPLSVMEWYSTVPVEERKSLYNLYANDFRLFGYTVPDAFFEE
ncbi:carbohydrate sulfotransferase 12-like [Synchiropus splendidus]|uniref:carbohydrate sulfotransferase 12-like n=1 Tax=Synchiropus splendidus TaxID=270530 RepID=UPI00237D842F|nr:carbohydrate sulfotransferase 12-like [Synchiropus splendidus]